MTEPVSGNSVPEPVAEPVMQVHDKCPSCGCTERDGEKWFEYLRKTGRVSNNLPLSNKIQVAVQDPEKLKAQALVNINGKVKIPIVVYTWDTCSKCGSFYATKVELTEQEGIAQVQRMPAPPMNIPRNIPRRPFRN